MRVILAEKPDMGLNIATAIGISKRDKGYITLKSGDIVTWAIGHLIQQKQPDTYPGYEEWTIENLPFVPEPIQMEEDPAKKDQLKVVKSLLQKSDSCVIATDPEREGEHIARTILEYVGYRGQLKRLWINDLTPETILQGFQNLKDASEYDNLAAAAKVRAAADYWMGITATRFFTVLAQTVLHESAVLSVGRVQTPTLRLVYDREQEIENFVPKPFYTVSADFKADQDTYRGQWFKEDPIEGKTYRLDSLEAAKAIQEKVKGHEGKIISYRSKEARRQAPSLLDGAALQTAARKLLGFDIQKSTKLLQSVYDKHYCSYPRTKSQHLSDNAADQLADNLNKLRLDSKYANLFPETIVSLKGNKRFVNNEKAAEHHAIVPTGRNPEKYIMDEKLKLSPDEEKLYKLILQHTLAAFHPEGMDQETEVVTTAAGELFYSKGVFTLKSGWRTIALTSSKEEESESESTPEKAVSKMKIPALQEGQKVETTGVDQLVGSTSKPRRLHDTDLVNMMQYAGNSIDQDEVDNEVFQQLKEKGIGTPATRVETIQKLIQEQFIRVDKSLIYLTDKGRHFMSMVYDHPLASIELTGEFEKKLQLVASGEIRPEDLQEEFKVFTYDILSLQGGLTQKMLAMKKDKPLFDTRVTLGECPSCGKTIIEGKKGFGCSGWKEGCTFTIWKTFRNAKITTKQATDLLAGKEILLKNILPSAEGKKPYDLLLKLNGDKLESRFPTVDDKSIGSCPLCQKPVISYGTYYACTGRQDGCPVSISQEFRKVKLPERAVKALLAGKEVLLKDLAKANGEGTYSIYIFLKDGKISSRFPETEDLSLGSCPRCQKSVLETKWNYSCSNRAGGCTFKLQKEFLGVEVKAAQIKKLLKRGYTDKLTGLKGGKNGTFDTSLGYDAENNRYSFVKTKS
ncbi:DNA topoisomerase-3 [Paenibacillus polymyxa]